MADIKCVVCSEPYDAWGVNHGDMTRWQAILFKQGAGCPSCEGVSPFEHPTDLEKLAGTGDEEQLAVLQDRLLLNPDEDGDLDLLSRLMDEDGSGPPNHSRPKWVQPAPKVFWTCTGCDVSVIVDPDDDYPDGPLVLSEGQHGELSYSGGKSVHYLYGHAYAYADYPEQDAPDEKAPFYLDIGNGPEPYCAGCVQTCDGSGCDTPIFSRSDLEVGDTHATGSSFMPPGKYNKDDALCIDCYEQCCSECGASPTEECTCEHESEETPYERAVREREQEDEIP